MLLQYHVNNFRSIGHTIEFSMMPTEDVSDTGSYFEIETKAGKWKVVRRGGFFGPNASGKTSFVKSLDFAKKFILHGRDSGLGTGINQFRGNIEELEGKSLFQFLFYTHAEVYEYGFLIDIHQVYEEWLSVLTEKDLEPMFIRETDENGKTNIEITDRFAGKNSQDRTLVEVLIGSIKERQSNLLFLKKLYENGIKMIEPVWNWFRNLQVIFPETNVRGLPILIKNNEEFKNFIAEKLEEVDTGIVGVRIADREVDFMEYAQKMDLPEKLIDEINTVKQGVLSINGQYFIFQEDKKRVNMIQTEFEHLIEGEKKAFSSKDESDGTRRFLNLLPMLFSIKDDSEKIFFVDEIDRSLHTKLSMYLLQKFSNDESNWKNQIIFTAHDVNLIDLEKFSQEEIWFVEKNGDGETYLRPFSDFDVREGQDSVKAYLNGRFGAVPVIRGGR